MKDGDRHPLLRQTIALVPAGCRASSLHALTEHRLKPAVCFGAGLRATGFAWSSCLNNHAQAMQETSA